MAWQPKYKQAICDACQEEELVCLYNGDWLCDYCIEEEEREEAEYQDNLRKYRKERVIK